MPIIRSQQPALYRELIAEPIKRYISKVRTRHVITAQSKPLNKDQKRHVLTQQKKYVSEISTKYGVRSKEQMYPKLPRECIKVMDLNTLDAILNWHYGLKSIGQSPISESANNATSPSVRALAQVYP
jgi:hypothetical protein